MSGKIYTIVAEWDDEAGVWYTAESDVPGLVVETDDFETFVAEVRQLVPELLRLNEAVSNQQELTIPLRVVRSERVPRAS